MPPNHVIGGHGVGFRLALIWSVSDGERCLNGRMILRLTQSVYKYRIPILYSVSTLASYITLH